MQNIPTFLLVGNEMLDKNPKKLLMLHCQTFLDQFEENFGHPPITLTKENY